jgi:hypothetical protein
MNMGQDMAAARTDLDKIVQSAEAQTTPTN